MYLFFVGVSVQAETVCSNYMYKVLAIILGTIGLKRTEMVFVMIQVCSFNSHVRFCFALIQS